MLALLLTDVYHLSNLVLIGPLCIRRLDTSSLNSVRRIHMPTPMDIHNGDKMDMNVDLTCT